MTYSNTKRVMFMFWKVLGAISLFNLLKSNQNDSNLNYEIEELKEKVNYLEKEKKRLDLKREIRNLKYKISKIDREIDNWDCGVEAPYFQNLCEEVAQLELKLFKLECELEHLESY